MASHHHGDDVVRDERASRQNGPVVDEGEMRAHHVDTLWLGTGVHLPVHSNGPHRHHRRRHRRHRDPAAKHDGVAIESEGDKKRFMPPGQRVQFLLNQDDDLGNGINSDAPSEAHRVFTEMVELHGTDANQEWRETARWVKFEEDVEEGGNRWSKPHVATLSLHSLFELRSCIVNGCVILDMEAMDFGQMIDIMLDKLIAAKHVEEDQREAIRDALMRKLTHQYEATKSGSKEKEAGMHPGQSFLQTVRSIADIGRSFSHGKNLQQHESAPSHMSTAGSPGHPSLNKQDSMPQSSLPGGNQLQLPKVASLPRDMARDSSTADASKLENGNNTDSVANFRRLPYSSSMHALKGNQHFFKKLPPGAEASNVLIGMVEFLEHHVSVFIRLKSAQFLGNLTEVPVPTRFLFILLGPADHGPQYREIGRAIATLMSDEVFHEVAYKAQNRNDLLDGVDEFLDQVTVLPPGEWDPNIRIEPPTSIPSQEKRKGPEPNKPHEHEVAIAEEEEGGGHGMDPALKRTGRLFGGLVADIKRKAPFYLSDIKDCLNLQCLAALMFMYFAMLAPIVTFGGLLDEATDQRMGAMENLLSGAICGGIYHIMSGQPLTMIGATGPVLVFEKIIFNICSDYGLDFLQLRFWIDIWSALILLIMVATDASSLVSYITRFTEESFAALISFIFIFESIVKLVKILSEARLVEWSDIDNENRTVRPTNFSCTCYNPGDVKRKVYVELHKVLDRKQKHGDGWLFFNDSVPDTIRNYTVDYDRIPLDYCTAAGGKLLGPDCYHMWDVFLMSLLLMIGTFALAMTLKLCRNSSYFPAKVRELVSNFAVIIAIAAMVLLDYVAGIATPKLQVPDKVEPTWKGRKSWIINPFDTVNSVWTIFVAIIPALLLCILLFMDHQITIVIVNRKENKLKKSCGYHLDLFVLALLLFINAVFGLPIFVAATVMSISHVNALRVESECRAPGEKPTFIGVREQRMTGFGVFLLIGISVVMTKALRAIPMPVLYGVFLYMGVSSLRGVQMVDRLLLLLMPMKYQPDLAFLRHVPIKRVHLFTAFQFTCFVVLCVIKEIKNTSIVFPLMLVVMIGVRKLMEYVFTERELKSLDDPMPEITLRKKEDAKKKKEQQQKEIQQETEAQERQGTLAPVRTEANLHIPLASGNVMKIPLTSIADERKETHTHQRNVPLNLSEELNKTGLWKHIESESSFVHKDEKPATKEPHTSSKKSNTGPVTIEAPEPTDDDDFEPITIKIDRASPMIDRGGSVGGHTNEMQPLLSEHKTSADDKKDDKQESSV